MDEEWLRGFIERTQWLFARTMPPSGCRVRRRGRTDGAIGQFEGTSLVCGQSVDKNWLYFTEEGKDMELRARVERLERLIGGNGVDDNDGKRLTGEEALAWMDGRGFSLLLGLANAQRSIPGPPAGGAHQHVATVEVRLT